jgi:hypothetical protein
MGRLRDNVTKHGFRRSDEITMRGGIETGVVLRVQGDLVDIRWDDGRMDVDIPDTWLTRTFA